MAQTEQHDSAPRPERIGVRECREYPSGFLRKASQGGSFPIMARDRVRVELRALPKAERPPQRPGAVRGKIRMAPDFDTLPSEVAAAMEGEEA